MVGHRALTFFVVPNSSQEVCSQYDLTMLWLTSPVKEGRYLMFIRKMLTDNYRGAADG